MGPEYGGDGDIIGRCDQFKNPEIGFPGHWAPNDLVFIPAMISHLDIKMEHLWHFTDQLTELHTHSRYFVAFIPFEGGKPTGQYEVFADGLGIDPIASVDDAKYRPMGIAFSPKGGMFIGDTEKGRIWKIQYNGDKDKFSAKDLAKMEMRKLNSNIRTPDKEKDKIEIGSQYEYKMDFI